MSTASGHSPAADRIQAITALPKVELHLHMDCCLSFDAARRLRPGLTEKAYAEHFTGGARLASLDDFLARTSSFLDLLQTRDGLEVCVDDLAAQLHADRVVYAELRFAPLQHLRAGLAPESVVDIVTSRIRECSRATGVEMRLILCGLWHNSPEESERVLRLVQEFRGEGIVVAMDMAGPEAHPAKRTHYAVLKKAMDGGIPVTVHAGEALGPEAVREVMRDLNPPRIGHGVRAAEDQALVQELARRRIHLETCPGCNVQIGVYPDLAGHPIEALYRAGASIGISTDQRGISATSLTNEYARIARAFPDLAPADFRRCNINALAAAFCDEATRARIAERIP